ncbi:hypothetical protein E2562_036146 [Oryza meyeriana var. granulata]|uniref:ATPase AAA-type core domain-containing protein n=1 Tax=Oryza meyeriana var. granulata TaxID=110450 RepID=A0A6G1E9N4_9ORYZ|nr:hypothetical protein E2562_036146 [Oryza meyeriana var. granulata]
MSRCAAASHPLSHLHAALTAPTLRSEGEGRAEEQRSKDDGDLGQHNQMLIGDGAKLVRDAFQLAKEKAPCIIFIDEIDAIGTKRFDSEVSGDREVQRTMLELLNQLDGFSSDERIKIHSRKLNVNPDVNFEELARSADDFNGMLALCRDATEQPVASVGRFNNTPGGFESVTLASKR